MSATSSESGIKDGFYYRPYTPPEYPEIPEGYLPENVRLHFEFGPHTHADHFSAVAERLEQTDIYIPEAAGAPDETLLFYKRVAKSGHQKFAKLLEDHSLKDFDLAQVSALQGKNKGKNRLAICLVPDIDAITIKILNAPRERTQSFAGELESLYDAYHRFQLLKDIRDMAILKNLGPTVTRAVVNQPKLRTKPEVAVLASLGSRHESIYAQLATSPNVSAAHWRINHTDFVLRQTNIVLEKVATDRPVTRQELMAAFLAESLNSERRNRSNEQTIEFQDALLRAAIDDIPNDSAEAMYRLTKGRATQADLEQNRKYVAAAKAQVGIQ